MLLFIDKVNQMIQIYNNEVYLNEYSAYNKDLIYNKMYVPLFSSPFFPLFCMV